MRVALGTKEYLINDIRGNLQIIIDEMKEAKYLGAEVLLLSEACLQGYDSLKWNYDFDKGIACNIYSEPINQICKESRKLNLDVIFGYFEKDRDLISSSCLIIERGEQIYNYKRLTSSWNKLYKKDRHYYAGQVVEVFEYRHKRCMIALSDDLFTLPELFMRNEEIIFWPTHYKDIENIDEYEERLKNLSLKFSSTHILFVNDNPKKCGTYYIKDGKIISSSRKESKDVILVYIDE